MSVCGEIQMLLPASSCQGFISADSLIVTAGSSLSFAFPVRSRSRGLLTHSWLSQFFFSPEHGCGIVAVKGITHFLVIPISGLPGAHY